MSGDGGNGWGGGSAGVLFCFDLLVPDVAFGILRSYD